MYKIFTSIIKKKTNLNYFQVTEIAFVCEHKKTLADMLGQTGEREETLRKAWMMWMDRVRSDLKQHQLDPKLAQNRETWRKAIMSIDCALAAMFSLSDSLLTIPF